jgi:hypothetical protein
MEIGSTVERAEAIAAIFGTKGAFATDSAEREQTGHHRLRTAEHFWGFLGDLACGLLQGYRRWRRSCFSRGRPNWALKS